MNFFIFLYFLNFLQQTCISFMLTEIYMIDMGKKGKITHRFLDWVKNIIYKHIYNIQSIFIDSERLKVKKKL